MASKDKQTKVDLTQEQEETLRKFLVRYTQAVQRKKEAEENLHDLCVALGGKKYKLDLQDGIALIKG